MSRKMSEVIKSLSVLVLKLLRWIVSGRLNSWQKHKNEISFLLQPTADDNHFLSLFNSFHLKSCSWLQAVTQVADYKLQLTYHLLWYKLRHEEKEFLHMLFSWGMEFLFRGKIDSEFKPEVCYVKHESVLF